MYFSARVGYGQIYCIYIYIYIYIYVCVCVCVCVCVYKMPNEDQVYYSTVMTYEISLRTNIVWL